MEKFVITIAREYCSGGQKIGTRLAEELGVNCYNSEMFRLVSKNENMKDDAVAHDDRIKDTSLFDVAKAIYTDPLPSPDEGGHERGNSLSTTPRRPRYARPELPSRSNTRPHLQSQTP